MNETQAIIRTGSRAVEAVKLDAGRFRELIERFLDGGADVADATKRLYRFGLGRLAAWLEDQGVENPLREDLVRFKEDLKGQMAPGSGNAVLTSVRAFFSWTDAARIYPDIAGKIKGFKRTPGHRRDPWTLEQILAALAAVPTDSIIGLRDRAIIVLLARTGARTIELIRADLGDVKNKGSETVLYYQGKGRSEKSEFKILDAETLLALREYLADRGETDLEAPLFCSESDRNQCSRLTTRTMRAIVKARFRAVGVDDPRLSAHSLRHFFGTNSGENGATLKARQLTMGHASSATTEIYDHGRDRMGPGAAERFISSFGLAAHEVSNAV